ncbi:MAG: hypothetical protein ACKVVT_18240 [Dehalococcoidia bacterium]
MPKRLQIAVALGAPFVVATLPLLAFLPFGTAESPAVDLNGDGMVAAVESLPVSQPVAYGIGVDCPLSDSHSAEG